ncbi:MAG: hypothetical protein FWE67_14980 [Planctomycetaceae bacterium]|nr:hypothetical protein [Planctomycetaceae bacterium]
MPRIRRLVMELPRSNFKPVPLNTEQFLFQTAEFERDCEDIVTAFPEDGPDFLELKQRREEMTKRFLKKIPCFVVREKTTSRLQGAVWMLPEGFDFLNRNQKHSAATVFQVFNLFLNTEKRGQGLGKQLLAFAIDSIFSTTDCEFIVSQTREHRISSLLIHLKIGFAVLGTHSAQKICGIYLPRFARINVHPLFNDFPKTPVILLTYDGANPLGIIRSLGRHLVPLYVLTTTRNTSLAWSRYVKKILTVSLDNTKEIQERLEDFLRITGSQTGKPILMLTNESHYPELEPLKDFLDEHLNVLTPLKKAIPLTSKNAQFPLALQAGFRVMETVMLRTPNDLNEVENKLAFPVIVRPTSNKLRDRLDMKTALYENISAMREHLNPLLSEEYVELIAQEFIPGTDRDILVFMASCDDTGEPRLWLSGRKVRQNPPGRGVMASGTVDPIPDADFVERSRTLCRLFGLRGFIGIECKQHAISKEHVYIESSFRPEGFNSMCLAAGVDLVWDSYLTALGKPCGAIRPEKYKGSWAYAELEHGTMKALLKEGSPDWWKVLIPLPRPISYAFFTWDDPLPFFHSFGTLLWRKIKRYFS